MAGVSSVPSKLSTWKNLEEPGPADTQRSNPIQRGYERENARGAAAGASRVACSPQQLQRPFHPSKRDGVRPTAHISQGQGRRSSAMHWESETPLSRRGAPPFKLQRVSGA